MKAVSPPRDKPHEATAAAMVNLYWKIWCYNLLRKGNSCAIIKYTDDMIMQAIYIYCGENDHCWNGLDIQLFTNLHEDLAL